MPKARQNNEPDGPSAGKTAGKAHEDLTRQMERLVVERRRRAFNMSLPLFRQGLGAVAVGAIAAGGSVLFRAMISFCHDLFFAPAMTSHLPVPVILALGGLAVGLWSFYTARFSGGSKGHGIPEVIDAVMMKGGHIPGRTAILKMVASSITIGSGGSAGREGPIVQIGASIGSKFASVMKLPEKDTILMLACGAAAGIASTFNAPLAGVFFALEILLGRFSARAFGVIALSTVTASVIARSILGGHPAFSVPEYDLRYSFEYCWVLLLGVLAGCIGVIFTRTFYGIEDSFARLKAPSWLKPALGGALCGLLAWRFPQVMGNGYEGIEASLNGQMDYTLMLALVFVKLVATSLTLGSGGSGGDLAPSLFIGSVLGGAFGCVVASWTGGAVTSSGAYALVGMAAVFGSAARAPITAVIMIFELTGDYNLILPLMAGTVLAVMTASLLDRDSIYTLELSRKGLDVSQRQDLKELRDPMRFIPVESVMHRHFLSVSPQTTLAELEKMFAENESLKVLPVVDKQGNFINMLTRKDLVYARLHNHQLEPTTPARRLFYSEPVYVCPGDPLAYALRTMGSYTVGRIAVVASPSSRRLVGLLYRGDIISAYNASVSSAPLSEERE